MDYYSNTIFEHIFLIAEVLKKECDSLADIVEYTDEIDSIVKKLSSLENEADTIYHEVSDYYRTHKLGSDSMAMSLLEIAETVEACTDAVNEIALDFFRYNITSVREEYVCIFDAIKDAAVQLSELILSIKRCDNKRPAIVDIIELDHYKSEFDILFSINMHKLFEEEKDPIEVIKWKEINVSFKTVFAAFEAVADACSRYVIFKE